MPKRRKIGKKGAVRKKVVKVAKVFGKVVKLTPAALALMLPIACKGPAVRRPELKRAEIEILDRWHASINAFLRDWQSKKYSTKELLRKWIKINPLEAYNFISKASLKVLGKNRELSLELHNFAKNQPNGYIYEYINHKNCRVHIDPKVHGEWLKKLAWERPSLALEILKWPWVRKPLEDPKNRKLYEQYLKAGREYHQWKPVYDKMPKVLKKYIDLEQFIKGEIVRVELGRMLALERYKEMVAEAERRRIEEEIRARQQYMQTLQELHTITDIVRMVKEIEKLNAESKFLRRAYKEMKEK